jgi:tRNA(Ile)-lysidine synthase
MSGPVVPSCPRPVHSRGSVAVRSRFASHLRHSALLAGDRRLLIALSGGLDSVCLLHLLRFGGFGFELHAAHFDHAMRPDSARDADWVRGLCHAWRIPLTELRAADPPRGEAAARDQRYAFLEQAAAAAGADAILTAHHADDQAETILFRLIRGTGVAGLAGIPPRRGHIARPLLPFTRAELQDHAVAVRLRWREDRTNQDMGYARNRLRHGVLPALEALRPGAGRRIAALAQRAAESESAWRSVVEDAVAQVVSRSEEGAYALARERLLGYHPHVRARVLRHLLQDMGCRPDRAGTRAAAEFISAGGSGSGLELPGRVRMEREFDTILLRRATAAGASGPAQSLRIEHARTGTGTFTAAGQRYEAHWSASRDGSDDRCAVFDLSSLRFPLELRGAQPGDRIRMSYGSKKLKKLFQERRIGRAQRARVPVLLDAAGTVLWAVGVARADAAAPRRGEPVFTITVLDGDTF